MRSMVEGDRRMVCPLRHAPSVSPAACYLPVPGRMKFSP